MHRSIYPRLFVYLYTSIYMFSSQSSFYLLWQSKSNAGLVMYKEAFISLSVSIPLYICSLVNQASICYDRVSPILANLYTVKHLSKFTLSRRGGFPRYLAGAVLQIRIRPNLDSDLNKFRNPDPPKIENDG